jgi:hypothetical protein
VSRKEKSYSFFFESKTSESRGKIRHLGFFRKQQYMRKQPFCLIRDTSFRAFEENLFGVKKKGMLD